MALLLTPPVEGTLQTWRDGILAEIPDLDIRLWPDVGDPADIHYLLIGRFDLADLPALPNLRFLMPMFAGIDHLVAHPNMPDVPIVRTGPPEGDPAMTEYAILHVLRHHRHMPDYLAQQRRKEWTVIPQKLPRHQRVGFMGFGTMAEPPARALNSLGFDVAAWVRKERQDSDIEMFCGTEALPVFLGRTDILVCLLPLTGETEGILNADTFAALPEGAAVINLGRGAHLVDEDLIAALDSGHLSAATLDATKPEPLPGDSPLWLHERVTIMPHTARRVRPDTVGPQVAEAVRLDRAGKPQIWAVDRSAGY
ncbi:MAG: glyoxylate/hydroxypyruvate reductase A [Alphaproteobacteria bacterium]|jgi:glyoxylate/hydroxypyruvate reductase|nr:glyoxylate/hydroxypyruvate reductase A [Alphaproteobacteria bacterium]